MNDKRNGLVMTVSKVKDEVNKMVVKAEAGNTLDG